MLVFVGRLCVGAVRSVAVQTRSFCTFTMCAEKLNDVPEVEIEDSGTFKYVLIKVYPGEPSGDHEPSKLIVRGGQKFGPYHGDIYDATLANLQKLGLDSECLGGGRIRHEPEKKELNVYGYSQGFGKADHQLTVSLLKKKYSNYAINWSDEDEL
ncbi:hypothetical protein R5R35_003609 [Gryllus longicercus]|uniref:Sex-regulated protein janus-A n=1 Tax=Gryllus longicercus TaxID=2509291 RepID=A0AAN9VAI5_9ORTH